MSPASRRTRRPRDAAPGRPPRPPDRALEDAAAVVGDRWSLLVVARLLHGPRRFADLLAELDGLAPNILARRLSSLEADGLVVGEPYSTRPVRHAYRLTARGGDLAGTLRMLAGWGAGAGRAGREAAPVHGACGSPLEVRWFCGTCDRVVADPAPADGLAFDDDGLTWL